MHIRYPISRMHLLALVLKGKPQEPGRVPDGLGRGITVDPVANCKPVLLPYLLDGHLGPKEPRFASGDNKGVKRCVPAKRERMICRDCGQTTAFGRVKSQIILGRVIKTFEGIYLIASAERRLEAVQWRETRIHSVKIKNLL